MLTIGLCGRRDGENFPSYGSDRSYSRIPGLQQLEAAEGGRYGSESRHSFPVSQARSPELLRFSNQTSGPREPKPLRDPS